MFYIKQLAIILGEAKTLSKNNYIDENYQNLANSIVKGEELLKEYNFSQDFIDYVKNELKDSVESLIEINSVDGSIKVNKEVGLYVSGLEVGFYEVHVTFEEHEIIEKLIHMIVNM